MTVWVCLLLFWLWPWRTLWSPRSRKHLLDRLELLICPFRNKPRNTVKITVVTCSSSCSLMGKWRPGERIPAGSWSVRKTRHGTFAVAWTRGGFPPQQCWGDSPWPCFLLPVLTKGLHSQWCLSVFLTWPHVVLAPQVQLFCEQNPSEVTASASPHVWSFCTFKLHLHCLICFLKAQKWDSPVNRMWGGKDADLGWLLPLGQGSAEHQGKGYNYEVHP